MNRLNKFLVLGFILACACFLSSSASPNSDSDKELLRPDNDEYHLDEADENSSRSNSESKKATSPGRMFLKKFLLFRNLFNTNTQPVTPIIITGAGATGTTSPTTTTATSPTATGTITTGNAGGGRLQSAGESEVPNSPDIQALQAALVAGAQEYVVKDQGIKGTLYSKGNAGTAAERIQSAEESEIPDAPQVPEKVDMQALQAALAAGAQEYVVTDQEIKGNKATRPNSVNLRRNGAKRGQVIQVRIPTQYHRHFKSGQKVMLNRPNKRRIVRKRVNQNRRRVNNNQNGNRNQYLPVG